MKAKIKARAKRKSTAKRKTTKKEPKFPETPNTPEKVLRGLLEGSMDLGIWRPRIEEALEFLKIPPKVDPLLDPPQFLQELPRPLAVKYNSMNGCDYVALGALQGYSVQVLYPRRPSDGGERSAVFRWGCAKELTEQRARSHWHNNRSTISDERRPNATALIDYVAAVCKHLDWKW
jgi:hypothetical protein